MFACKKYLKIAILTLVIGVPGTYLAQAQKSAVDSLINELKNANNDTSRCNLLMVLIDMPENESTWPGYNKDVITISENNLKNPRLSNAEFKFFKKVLSFGFNNIGYLAQHEGDFFKALEFYQKSLEISKEMNDLQDIADYMINLGSTYNDLGDAARASEYYNKSLEIKKKTADKNGIATLLNNLGFIADNQGNVSLALSYYDQCLRVKEELGDKTGMATALNNIGYVYKTQGDYAKSMEYLTKSLRLREEIKDRKGVSDCLNNLGTLYFIMDNKQEALKYFERSLEIKKEIKDKEGLARALNNIGGILTEQGEFNKGLEYLLESLKIREEISDKKGVATALNGIGAFYAALAERNRGNRIKNYNKAREYCSKSLVLSRELGSPFLIKMAAANLSDIFRATNNYKAALENYELYIRMRDSLNNESTRKASIKSQLKYEYEKQAAADSVAHAKESEIKNAEISKQTAEIKAKKNQQYALFGGLVLVMIFAGLIYNRFKVTKRQKEIIERQKKEVEAQKHLVDEKQKEILDSIRYAQRIQRAHLPNVNYIKKCLERL